MNDAQKHVQAAMRALETALVSLDEASACVRAQGLKDFDARALSITITNVETAELWARRALHS